LTEEKRAPPNLKRFRGKLFAILCIALVTAMDGATGKEHENTAFGATNR
jgi:hypothetical protein